MKTTFKTLLKSVMQEKDVRVLNMRLNNLYASNKHSITYDDMLNLIQNAIMYNLNNKHVIEAANFYMKFKCLFFNFLKRKDIINIESIDELIDKKAKIDELNYDETLYYEIDE
jgi:hypothetical protein